LPDCPSLPDFVIPARLTPVGRAGGRLKSSLPAVRQFRQAGGKCNRQPIHWLVGKGQSNQSYRYGLKGMEEPINQKSYA